jgi:hypothetical protein
MKKNQFIAQDLKFYVLSRFITEIARKDPDPQLGCTGSRIRKQYRETVNVHLFKSMEAFEYVLIEGKSRGE